MESKGECTETATPALTELLPSGTIDSGAGAFRLSDGRFGYLTLARAGVLPSVDQKAGTAKPPNPGTVEDFASRHEQNPALLRQLRNKVRKCEGCGKPVAFTLSSCNGCGRDLSSTPISFTNNVFVGFIYGIEKGPFPLTVSLRHEDEEILVFDDLLALTTCHLNGVPTSAYLPDWRYLLKAPERGLALIDSVFNRCWSVVEEQFWSNEAWRTKVLRGKWELKDLKEYIAAGFNYPPSQYQLHLQFMLPPFLPFHYALYLQGVHFTYGRFFPYEYVRAVLKLNEPLAEAENMPIEDVVTYFRTKGVDYDEMHQKCYARSGASHEALGNWQRQDFAGVGVLGSEEIHRFDGDSQTTLKLSKEDDPKATQAADKLTLQNYGRPYTPEGKPRGSYYGYAKSFPATFSHF